jgi:hypothetical protein
MMAHVGHDRSTFLGHTGRGWIRFGRRVCRERRQEDYPARDHPLFYVTGG